jgi:DNA invertase Pin-like site-specific DNA recombinase
MKAIAFVGFMHASERERREQAASDFCTARGWELNCKCYTAKDPSHEDPTNQLHFQRPSAQQLLEWMRGYPVVLFSGIENFASASDAHQVLQSFREQGVTVHLLQEQVCILPQSAEGDPFLAGLACAVQAEKARLSRIARSARARSKAAGTKLNGATPLGYRWVGRGKQARLVADEEERAMMAVIAKWHKDGYSYRHTWRILVYHQVPTRDSREWSLSRIRRGHRWYLEHEASPKEPTEASAGAVPQACGEASTLGQ